MAENNYVSPRRLSRFLENLKNTFSPLKHEHKISDISDYVVDSALSSDSTNPVQNKVVNSAIATATEAIQANTNSINAHSTAISNLQTAVSEIQEITSEEIRSLFASN